MGGVFAMFKIGRDEMGECVGFGIAKCFLHAFPVGLKDFIQLML